ncbi:sensor domain CHASE-containing protein [Bradyrhizobium sp. AZCC 2289]
MPATTRMRALPVGNKKRNALKHGANASEVMLWDEKYKDYEALCDGLYQEFSPRAAQRNIWSKHSWICVGAGVASSAMSRSRSKSD